ncbi:MAG: O-antigen ligase family protein [Candidatus Omnitrophota bacterium]
MSAGKSRVCSGCDKFIEYLLYTLFFFISSSKSVLEVFATIAILIWLFKKSYELRERIRAKAESFSMTRASARSSVIFALIGVLTMVMVYVAIVVTMGIATKHTAPGVNLLAPAHFIPIVLIAAVLLAMFYIVISSVMHSLRLDAGIKASSVCYLLVAIITSAFTTGNLAISAGALMFKTMEYFLLFIVIADVINTREKLARSVLAFIFPASIVGLDGLYQYYSGHDLFRHFPLFEKIKVTATFKFSNSAGTFFATVLPLPLSLFMMNTFRGSKRALLAVSIAVIFACLMLTQARAAWLGFASAFIFLCVISGKKRFYALLASLLVVVALLAVAGPQSLKDQIGSLVNIGRDQSSKDRLLIWETGWRMFMDRPVFGHGLGTFMSVFEKYRPAGYSEIVYAHNCLLQVAAETGIAGVLASLWIAAAMFISGLKNYFREKDVSTRAAYIGFIGGLLATMVNSLFDTNLYSLPLAVLFWSVAGLSVAKTEYGQPEN